MVRHYQTNGKLDAFVDDELPVGDGRAVLRHLAECEDCWAQARVTRNIKRVLWGVGSRTLRGDTLADLRVFVDNLDR